MNTLTRKQRNFVNILVNNPKKSATQAAFESYAVKNRHVAEQIAYENMRKPEVLTVLYGYGALAADTLVSLLDTPDARVRFNASTAILDRVYGKPAQQPADSSPQKILVNIDLTGRSPSRQ